MVAQVSIQLHVIALLIVTTLIVSLANSTGLAAESSQKAAVDKLFASSVQRCGSARNRFWNKHQSCRDYCKKYWRSCDPLPTRRGLQTDCGRLEQFAGTYSSKELDVSAVLTIEGEKLVVHPAKMPPITLVPVTIYLFIGGDWRVRFERDSQARVAGL